MIHIGYGVYIQKSQIASIYRDGGENILVSLSSGEKFFVGKEYEQHLFAFVGMPPI